MAGKSGTPKGYKYKSLMCIACKVKFPRAEIEANGKICDECKLKTKYCECGCDTVIPMYQRKGLLRTYASGHVKKCKGRHNSILTCKACEIKFPYNEITNNGGFCNECTTHTKLCNCGCGKTIFKYTKNGTVRKYLTIGHMFSDESISWERKKRKPMSLVNSDQP